MKNQQEITIDILECLTGQDIKNCTEILGNVFLQLGLSSMGIKKQLDQKEILNIVLQDIETNGETINNALVRQGLLTLSWSNKETKYE